MRRRDALAGLAAAGGAWLVGCGHDEPAMPATDAAFPMPACEHDAIVESLLAERADALVVLKRWLSEKRSDDALYAAALTVGARTVVVEDDLHSALVVNGAYLMSKRAPPALRQMPLCYAWNMQLAASNAVRDAPPLAPIDPATLPSARDAERALLAAFDAWDMKAAEAAVIALYAAGGRNAVLGPLLRFALRNHNWVGHTAIWVVYAIRAMDALGWQCAPWVLRSLVRAINVNRKNASTGAFEANLKRVGAVPAADGVDDASAVPALLDILRVGDARACVDAVLAQLAAGKSRRTIWTALTIAAVELSVRYQESSFGVHELDTINALRHLYALSPDRDTSALALLQAAAWRPEFRAFLAGKAVKLDERLDAIAPSSGAPPTLVEAFDAIATNRIDGTRKLAAYLASGGTVEQVMNAYIPLVVERTSGDAHHYKFNAALFEEVEAALPEARNALMLGITLRGPTTRDAKWSRYDDARAIIGAP
jgi:hypothetical protein